MRKKIVIGTIIAIFLMLMMTISPAIEINLHSEQHDVTFSRRSVFSNSFNNSANDEYTDSNKEKNTTEYYALIAGCSRYEKWRFNIPRFHPFSESTMMVIYHSLVNAPNWKEENIYLLLNEDATKSNIINTLNHLKGIMDNDDILVFSWMGHGTIIQDDNGDEQDGTDEAICPYDTKIGFSGLQNIITDDELDFSLSQIQAKGQFLIFESCMSGGMVEDESLVNTSFADLNNPRRVVVMSTLSGKLGFAMTVVGWPISFLYSCALSDVDCDRNQDGWISAEEAFYQVDTRYPSFEYNWFSTMYNKTMNRAIPFAVLMQFLMAHKLLKKFMTKPVLRLIISSLWALCAKKVYQTKEFRQYMITMLNEMMKIQLEMYGVENNPNMLDTYPDDLNIVKIL